jgi:hypothetical protein
MTVEKRMSRARRNSVVQKIAHNIPQLEVGVIFIPV